MTGIEIAALVATVVMVAGTLAAMAWHWSQPTPADLARWARQDAEDDRRLREMGR